MNSFELDVDPRDALYGRFASMVLRVLNEAVDDRAEAGATKAEIAAQIGCDRSQLSRTLNGRARNLTIKTIADILWATRYEPQFEAKAFEAISPNYVMPVAPATLLPNVKPSVAANGPTAPLAATASASSVSYRFAHV